MTDQEKAADYDLIRQFVADTINTRNVKFGPPSADTEPHEAWGFRQIVKRFFPDLSQTPFAANGIGINHGTPATQALAASVTSVMIDGIEGESMPYVAYYRVSTERQGDSGLGLAAQRQAVAGYIRDSELLAEFQEIESGKRHTNRPKLAAALELCRRSRATLVIAKLDRLARNVHFISGLMESKVDFVAVDMPEASPFTIHILAAVAEHERKAISQRTKAAMHQVKRELAEKGQRVSVRGRVYTRLGNPPGYDTSRASAARHPAKLPPTVIELMQQKRAEGMTYRAIADHLDSMGIRTPRGHRWHNETIRDILSKQLKVAA